MSAYIKLSTLEYPRHIGDIALDKAGAQDYAMVTWVDPPTYDRITQRCYETSPVEVDGSWFMQWIVREATAEEIEKAQRPVGIERGWPGGIP